MPNNENRSVPFKCFKHSDTLKRIIHRMVINSAGGNDNKVTVYDLENKGGS